MKSLSSCIAEQYQIFRTLKPIFIEGLRRSGTTLMQRLLDAHPQLLVYPQENCLIAQLLALEHCKFDAVAAQKAIENQKVEKILSIIFPPPGFYSYFPISQTDLFKRYFCECLLSMETRWTVYDLLTAWVFSYFYALGINDMAQYRRWLIKSPTGGQCVALYRSVFSDCDILFVARDLRAIYASRCKGNQDSNPFMKINRLKRLIGKYRRSSFVKETWEHKSTHFLTVQYEDLVSDVPSVMRRVAEFLNISFEPVLTHPTLMGKPSSGNSSFELQAEFKGQVYRQSKDRWKSFLRWHERAIIELFLKISSP